MVSVFWPSSGLPLEGTGSPTRLEVLEVLPQPGTQGQGCWWGHQNSNLDLRVSLRQQDRGCLLLFLDQLFCFKCLIGFLTTFSAAMLSNLKHILLTSSGVSKKQLYSSHLFLACFSRPWTIAQPVFLTAWLQLALFLPSPPPSRHTKLFAIPEETHTSVLFTQAVSASVNDLLHLSYSY